MLLISSSVSLREKNMHTLLKYQQMSQEIYYLCSLGHSFLHYVYSRLNTRLNAVKISNVSKITAICLTIISENKHVCSQATGKVKMLCGRTWQVVCMATFSSYVALVWLEFMVIFQHGIPDMIVQPR